MGGGRRGAQSSRARSRWAGGPVGRWAGGPVGRWRAARAVAKLVARHPQWHLQGVRLSRRFVGG